MTRHLTTEQAIRVARRAVGGPVEVRGVVLERPDGEAYELVVAVAAGEIDDVTEIARTLARRVG